MTIWTEVTALEPGRRLESAFHGPWMSGVLVYSIEPRDGGCILRQRETLVPHEPLRLVAGLMDRMLRPQVVARLAEIRDLLETEDTRTPR